MIGSIEKETEQWKRMFAAKEGKKELEERLCKDRVFGSSLM